VVGAPLGSGAGLMARMNDFFIEMMRMIFAQSEAGTAANDAADVFLAQRHTQNQLEQLVTAN
jgi:hypothetical protein